MALFGTYLGIVGSSAPVTFSADFGTGGNAYLSMSDANFGAFDLNKWGLSIWFNLEPTGNRHLFDQASGVVRPIEILFSAGGNLNILTGNAGGSINTNLVTTASFGSGWKHALILYDSAQAISTDRVMLYIDGVLITSFTTAIYPALNEDIRDESTDVNWSSPQGGQAMKGKLFQPGFFSGTLPSIGDVFDSGVKDISGLPGLKSLVDITATTVTGDIILVANWTNNNGIVTSTDVPT